MKRLATRMMGVLLGALGGGSLVAGPIAEVLPPPTEVQGGLLTQVENDLWGGTDELYTSGLRVLYAMEVGPGMLGAGLATVSLSQLILNPTEIYRKIPDEDDRPYAGYLHLGLALHDILEGQRARLSYGLDLGMVGPSSLGEAAQNAYHDFKDLERPQGWDEQIGDEPILQISYEAQFRPAWASTPSGEGWAWDHLVLGGANVGNGFIYAEAGTELRGGLNLQPRWATSLISPGSAASSPLPWAEGAQVPSPTLSVEMFTGARGRLVARDITLDGNTFKDSRSVDKNYAVADLYAGVGIGYGWFSLTFTETYRTPEFDGQDSGQLFGSLAIGVSY